MQYMVKPMDKGQDAGRTGEFMCENGERCEWMVGLDGHGNYNVIDFMKSTLDWSAAMKSTNSLQYIIDAIAASGINTRQTGSTYVEAKMYPDRIETCNVGDSGVFVYINHQLVYNSTPHNMDNPSEEERLSERIRSGKVVVTYDQHIPIIESPSVLNSQAKPIFRYENGDRLNLTQALGHEGITGYLPERNTIPFEKDDHVVVIIGSDGLTEMLLPDEMASLCDRTVEEIVELAETRWIQEWRWKGWDKRNPDKETKTRFDRYDDVLAMKWEKSDTKFGTI